jgi:hypothetical protein
LFLLHRFCELLQLGSEGCREVALFCAKLGFAPEAMAEVYRRLRELRMPELNGEGPVEPQEPT